MENEILEILKSMNEKFDRLEAKIDDNINDIKELKDGQKRLEESQNRIEKKIDITYDQVARTAEDVTSIKDDMSTVETVTAKNWADIVKLKAIK